MRARIWTRPVAGSRRHFSGGKVGLAATVEGALPHRPHVPFDGASDEGRDEKQHENHVHAARFCCQGTKRSSMRSLP